MFIQTPFFNTAWNKAAFRVRLARIRQVFMILVFIFSLVGMSPISTAAAPAGTALQFNGSNQYVTFGSAAGTTTGLGVQVFTIETWFKRTGNGITTSTGTGGVTAVPLVTKGRGENENSNVDMNYFFGIDGSNHLAADFEECASSMGAPCVAGGTAGLNHPVTGSTAIQNNIWYHAAVTYDGQYWKLYLNGNLETMTGSDVGATRYPRWDSIQHAGIGTAMTSTGVAAGFFNGVIDETRIWNVVRTQSEIQASMNSELTSGTGLIGRWGLNEGSGTTTANAIAGRPDGTLINTPTWVTGFPIPDFTPPAAPTGLAATPFSSGVSLTWDANSEPDLAGYNVYRSESPSVPLTNPLNGVTPVSGASYSDGGLLNGTPYYYVVTAVDSSTNESGASNEVDAAPLESLGAALQFDGANDYVTFGPNLNATAFTLEAWVKRDAGGATMTTGTNGLDGSSGRPLVYPVLTKGMGEGESPANINMNWFLGITSTGVIGADFEDNAGGVNHPAWGTTSIPVGEWHHIAATYTGSCWALYLDGNLDALNGSVTECPSATPEFNSIQHAGLAAGIGSTGQLSTGFFAGTIDEARVWNRALSPTEILNNKDFELTSGSGLLARWGMNEGSGTTISSSVGSFPGALTNGPAWVPGHSFAPPVGNQAPDVPTLNAPTDGATGLGTSPTLDVSVSDLDGDALTVTFFGRPYASGVFAQFAQNPGIVSGSNTTTSWANLGAGQTFEWYVTVSDGLATTTGPTWTFHTDPGADPIFVGVGDIAACTVTTDTDTGNIVKEINGTVFTTGDDVYYGGTAQEYADCYAPTPWGDPSVLSRTRPIAGNHDWGIGDPYNRNDLVPYFAYFGANATDAGGKSYYSYDINSNWHVVNLETECALVGGCNAGSPQEIWLKADLAANSAKNVIALWHKPRYSSGATNLQELQPLWDDLYAAGVDILMDGHDHIYERFAPMKSGATPSDPPVADPLYGIRQFTVGMGGESHHALGTTLPTSEVRNNTTFGIFKLTLHATTYDWEFLPIDGETFTDSGTGTVHEAPSTTGAALQFDGANDYVTFGQAPGLGVTNFTLETWFNWTGGGVSMTTSGTQGLPSVIPLISKGRGEADGSNVDTNYFLGIDTNTGALAADFEDMASGMNYPFVGTTPVTTNTWHHAAVTYDSVQAVYNLYLDGNLAGTYDIPGTDIVPRYDSIQHAGLGTAMTSAGAPAGYFQGMLDEARIWNVVRTQEEIRSTINSELTSGTGLVARWGLNEGTGTTIASAVGIFPGTLTNGPVWVTPGAPFDLTFDTTPPDAPTSLTATPGANSASLTWTANSEPDLAGYNVYRSTTSPVTVTTPINTSLVTSPAYIDSTATFGSTYYYAITAVDTSNNESGLSNEAEATPTEPTEDAYALEFDGTNDYVALGVAPGLGVSTFTIETWFYWMGGGVTANTGSGGVTAYPLVTKGLHESDGSNVDANYFLGITTTGHLAADFEANPGGQNYPITGVLTVSTNTWHHAAVSYDGQVWNLYLDGNLDATNDLGTPRAPRSDSIQKAGIGAAMNSTTTVEGRFHGTIDEVRIWNFAKSQSEIRATINSQLTSGTGLVARWGLNEGTGTTAYSSVGDFPGTLVGLPTWVAPGAPFNLVFETTPPAAPTGLTAMGANASITLDWDDNSESDLAGYNVYRSATPAGSYTKVNTALVTDSSYSDTGLTNGIEYYYVVRAVDTSANESADSNETYAIPLADLGSGLEFTTASGTYVTFGDPAKLDLATFTIETWFKRTGAGTPSTTGTNGIPNAIPLVTHGAPQAEGSNVDANWVLAIDDTNDVIAADFEDMATGLNHPVYGVTPITDGVWHHAAATWDGTNWRLYLDGKLEITQSEAGFAPRSDTTQLAALGTMLTTTGGTNGFFQGVLDEARVWNRALTQNEIVTDINQQLSSGTGLVARWGLNEGAGATVGDSVVPVAVGTITGSNYAWVPGAPFDLNLLPDVPTLVAPTDGATGVPTSATLTVNVGDAHGSDLNVSFYGRLKNGAPGADFTLIAIPDPQYYAASYPSIYNAQMTWVVANKTPSNIPYAISLGDNVDTASDTTQWDVAATAWDILTTGGVPYGMEVGNHDGAPSTTGNFNTYFGSRIASQPTYGGRYGTSDYDNTYATFSASGMDFIVLYIEYDPAMTSTSNPVLVWANGILQANPTKSAIVVTHDLLSGNNFTSQGSAIYNALKENSNLFLMLGGHLDTAGQRTDVYNGHTVYSLRSDYQFVDSQQSGYLRVMRFSPADNTIYVTTYSPTQSKNLTDTANQFDLAYTMGGAADFGLIGSVSNVPAGSNVDMTWVGLLSNDDYEWYAVSSNGADSAVSPTWSFTTETNGNNPPVITESDPQAVSMSEDGLPIPFSLTLNATDVDLTDTLSWSISSPASHGTAVASGTGASQVVGYTPDADYNGSDSFGVQVSDGNGGTDTLTVNVTIEAVNDAPLITGQSVLSTPQNTPLTITLPDLTVTDVDNPYPTGFTLTVLAGTNYTFVGDTITPATDFTGTLTVPVKVNDGAADSNTYNLSVSVTPLGPTYYVDNTNAACSDLGTGMTPALPFCTIGKAGSIAVAGDTVRVLAGTYAETVNGSNSGSAGLPITYSAAPGVTVTGNGTTSGSAFRMTSKSYIVVDGFNITGTVDYGIYVFGSNHITISNNHVSYSGTPASGSTRMGIYFSGTSDSLITGNISDHNSQDGIRLTAGCTNVTVSNNVVYANAEQWQRNATGIHVNGSGSANNTIIHNMAYANEDTGLQFYAGAHDNLVLGNLSYGNGDHGIDNNAAPNNVFIGNTVYGNVTVGMNFEGGLSPGSGGATVINNISVDNGLRRLVGGGTSAGSPGNIRVDAQSLVGTTLDYNQFYLSTGTIQIEWNNISYTSLAAFQAAVPGQETHGLQADPLFVAPAPIAERPPSAPYNVAVNVGDYHLTAGSPAIDSANADAPNQPTTDIEGNPRVDDPDVANSGTGARTYDDRGAYEFQPSGLSTHSIPLVTGWNLVSFNLHPADTAIATVLASIDGNYDLVYAWDATSTSDNWLLYDPSVPIFLNSLTQLDETVGFWIHMTTADTLEVIGTAPGTTAIPLSTTAGGWNLVAYPSLANHPLPDALSNNGCTDFSLVYAYIAQDATPWKLFDPSVPPFLNDLTEMAPGLGYWVRVNTDCTWSVTYQP